MVDENNNFGGEVRIKTKKINKDVFKQREIKNYPGKDRILVKQENICHLHV